MIHEIEKNGDDFEFVSDDGVDHSPVVGKVDFPKVSDAVGIDVFFWDFVFWDLLSFVHVDEKIFFFSYDSNYSAVVFIIMIWVGDIAVILIAGLV